MQFSAPIYVLKRKARHLSRQQQIPLHAALDMIARTEGFARWGLLAAKATATPFAHKLFARLEPGDLLLVGARPGQGKTLFCLELAAEAAKVRRESYFFTLEYTERETYERFRAIGFASERLQALVRLDCSDDICADHIMQRLADAGPGTLAIIDYLQLLDQKREHPGLMAQVQALRAFARARSLIFVFISQIDRAYERTAKPCPDLSDVRLPNPLDLGLFSKTCFINEGRAVFGPAR